MKRIIAQARKDGATMQTGLIEKDNIERRAKQIDQVHGCAIGVDERPIGDALPNLEWLS